MVPPTATKGQTLMTAGILSVLSEVESFLAADAAPDHDLLSFAEVELGVSLTPTQREIFQSVQTNRRTAVKSCHASGKTYAAAALVIAFLHVYPQSKVITTAPGSTHVREGLWQDIRSLAGKAPGKLRGAPLTTKWELGPNWFAMGFSPGPHGSGRLQGHHAPRVLLIVDEAAEVEDEIYEALDSLMTSDTAHLLLIGNPTIPRGRFHAAFTKQRSRWNCITIRALDTPNIMAGRTVIPGLIDQAWVDEAIDLYGPEDPYVLARVHAEFPEKDDESFIVESVMADAALRAELPPVDTPIRAGLDLARFGGDESCLVIRQGDYCHSCTSWRGADLMATTGRVRSLLGELLDSLGRPMVEAVNVDIGGLGAGVYDRLEELRANGELPVERLNAVNFGGKPSDKQRFKAVRDEMWWVLRERFNAGDMSGVIDSRFIEQASALRAAYDSSHTAPVVESKDVFRRREGRSPDQGDAYCLAYYVPDGESGSLAVGGVRTSQNVFQSFGGDLDDDDWRGGRWDD